MSTPNYTIINSNLSTNRSETTDYKLILKSFGITEVTEYDFYFKIGSNSTNQGWMFHIPVWDIQFESLSKHLIPYLLKHQLTFWIPLDISVHQAIQGGGFGFKNLGKIITIIPQNDTSLSTLAENLIEITKPFKGTPVPTDFHLGSIVYTRYGSFNFSQDEIFIVNDQGFKLMDDEPIPPQIYNWVPWPFMSITSPIIPRDKKILNDRYLIKKIIKPDIKGKVMKALYQNNIFTFKSCIIKEGVKGIGVDDIGRDITNRLDWQLTLYKSLNHLIPIPRIIDNFEDNNSKYLVFEFVNGKSLGNYLIELYQGRSWYELKANEKLNIIKILILVAQNVQKIHSAGYVHRDLNVENIFIDKNLKVWLLDLELMYDMSTQTPNPPYERGTEGYISPEQIQLLTPKPEQDIYSIGAILMMALLHISPEKFNTENNSLLRKQFSFFNNESEITTLISDCLNQEKIKRPKIDFIYQFLVGLSTQQIQTSISAPNFNINRQELAELLTRSIHSLSLPSMTNTQGYWSSTISSNDNFVGNVRLDRTIYTGFRKGISGVLYLIGEASICAINPISISTPLSINFERLTYIIQTDPSIFSEGLYKGSYGMAIALASLLKSNRIICDTININLLKSCLENIPSSLSISDGVSGYGLSLIKCKDYLPEDFILQRLELCLKIISSSQLSNGAWYTNTSDNRSHIITGFPQGMAGIIWFLLRYSETFGSEEAKNIAIKGLHYLLKKMKKINGNIVWPLAISEKELHEFSNGGYYVLLPFIKAFKITQNIKFKTVVEAVLNSYPQYLVSNMLNLERGAAGLGEVYIEAWEAFGNEKWLKRAEWIAGLLINTAYNKEDASYWILHDPFHPYADLLTGNSGIIHFLLRIYRPDIIKAIF